MLEQLDRERPDCCELVDGDIVRKSLRYRLLVRPLRASRPTKALTSDSTSYHIIICGTLLFGFSLFMLSLSQPEQYYQVSISFQLLALRLTMIIGIPGTRNSQQYSNRYDLYTCPCYRVALFQAQKTVRIGCICGGKEFREFVTMILTVASGICYWRRIASDHAQPAVPWSDRIPQRRPR